MSYKTVEVEVDNGRVRPQGLETLPLKARGLLTILPPVTEHAPAAASPGEAGLRRFLSSPDLPLTPAQFRASMEADFFEQ